MKDCAFAYGSVVVVVESIIFGRTYGKQHKAGPHSNISERVGQRKVFKPVHYVMIYFSYKRRSRTLQEQENADEKNYPALWRKVHGTQKICGDFSLCFSFFFYFSLIPVDLISLPVLTWISWTFHETITLSKFCILFEINSLIFFNFLYSIIYFFIYYNLSLFIFFYFLFSSFFLSLFFYSYFFFFFLKVRKPRRVRRLLIR